MQHDKILLPDGDILIHTGDFTKKGSYFDIRDFLNWFVAQPHVYKIFIAGNHEIGLDRGPMRESKLDLIKTFVKSNNNLFYLENSGINVCDLEIWGSPASPFFYNWSFNYHRGEEIANIWKNVPNTVNILMTHGPPLGILDSVPSERVLDPSEKVGCEDLLNRVKQLKQLKLHAFGHIHTGHGVLIQDNVTFVNAAICGDRGHIVEYEPTVIEL